MTVSPIHLLFPVVELTAELRLVDHFGLAVQGGFGSMSADTGDGESERFSVQELGGQLSAYPLSAFDSLILGAEVLYVRVSGASGNVTGIGDGLAVGPFVGYKYLADSGFTLFVQGGFQYVALAAEASDDGGTTAKAEKSNVIPLLNFNLGWSF